MAKIVNPPRSNSAAEKRMGVSGNLTQKKAVKRNNMRVKRKANRG